MSSYGSSSQLIELSPERKAYRDFQDIKSTVNVTNPEAHIWFLNWLKEKASPELMRLYLLEYET